MGDRPAALAIFLFALCLAAEQASCIRRRRGTAGDVATEQIREPAVDSGADANADAGEEPEAPPRPHILMLLVDDWGWANVGYHREVPTPEVQTPNIDALAMRGLRLEQHYVFHYCSPTRCSLLSGRLPIHVNDLNINPGYSNASDPVSGFQGIPRNMTAIAAKLKEAGYATHHAGKWDAGMATLDHTPRGRGFDTSLGYFHHANDYYTEVQVGDNSCNRSLTDIWEDNGPAYGLNETHAYEEYVLRDRVLEIIDAHDPSQPLFMYYAMHLVHAPLQVPDVYYDRYDFIDDEYRRRYHAMVACLDDIVGNLSYAFHQNGLWDNLLWVTASDNGGPLYLGGGANNYPLRGGKGVSWQGGIRGNAFVTGGFLPTEMHGKTSDGKVHVADWYGTFCALAGVDTSDPAAEAANLPPVDSLNMWPLISGGVLDNCAHGENDTSPRVDVPTDVNTLISGDLKILIGNVGYASWSGPQYPNSSHIFYGGTVEHCGDSGCLFNITADPNEYVRIDQENPTARKEMRDKLSEYQATYFNPNRGDPDPLACETALNKYGGFWGPFIFP